MARPRVLKIIERRIKRGNKTVTKIYARTSFTGRDGKRHTIWRAGETRTEARERLETALEELKERGERAILKPRGTFAELAAYFKSRYIQPPTYVDERKVAGMRSHRNTSYLLPPLLAHFGGYRLKDITHGDLEDYKRKRLAEKIVKRRVRYVKEGKKRRREEYIEERQRSVASVNRELALMRRILNIGVRQGWLKRNPFSEGDTLISLADERQRERILSSDEEDRLLMACTGKREHLRPILICALDTGMRQGEIFSLRWADVDFSRRVLSIKAANTKTMRAREVPVSTRLMRELKELYEKSDRHPETRVFGVETNVKRSFAGACEDAGIKGFRFHDTRHSAATRFIRLGLSLQEVGRILGHTQWNTTMRYINVNTERVHEAARLIDEFHEAREKKGVVN